MTATIVLDIGKTNVKLALLDEQDALLEEHRLANTILRDGPYPHHDVERIWNWMGELVRTMARKVTIGAIVPVTHGATAALVNDHGLVLPILDYEHAIDGVTYSHRPPYRETCSPALPAGLNLGRQLAWQAEQFPEEFSRAEHLLMYPQYWAWRLSGVAAGEVTSLGCHTDLWDPVGQRYSSLVERMGWERLLPPLQPAWAAVGTVRPAVAQAFGLSEDCLVICGIHDSNASLLRYLDMPDVTVLSTGTWMIAAALHRSLSILRERDDMLANTNALGAPVACMRYMGGREFSVLAGENTVECTIGEIEKLIRQRTIALPCFADGGPFLGQAGRIDGPQPATASERYALATLYSVLMTDHCLGVLGATGPVVIEGSFAANAHLAGMLAALRPTQPILVSGDASGTTAGGWMLHRWGRKPHFNTAVIAPSLILGIEDYRSRWLAEVESRARP